MQKVEIHKTNNRFNITDECNLLLWYIQKFPWLTLEQIQKHFYSNISNTNGYKIKRINFLVKSELLNKWKTPHLHYSLSSSGIKHLDYWKQKIFKYKSKYSKSLSAHNYTLEYIEPQDLEPRFQDYTHSNHVIETVLAFSKYDKFEIVESLDFIRNKKQSLFINNFPDILMMNFEKQITLRYIIEIENSPISLEKMVSKLVRNFKDTEGQSDLVENLKSIEEKPVATFHLFYCTSIQILNYYIKSIRQIMGTNFEPSTSEEYWQRKWTQTYKLEKWEKKLKFKSSEFQRWLQSGRLFFGILPSDYNFKEAELVTYDNLKYYNVFPVPQGAGTDKNIKSFDPMKNF